MEALQHFELEDWRRTMPWHPIFVALPARKERKGKERGGRGERHLRGNKDGAVLVSDAWDVGGHDNAVSQSVFPSCHELKVWTFATQ